jgi:hypothetical protein
MRANSQRRLEQLIAAHGRGLFNDDELVNQFAYLLESEQVDELLASVPSTLAAAIKAAIALGNSSAADDEHLEPEDSPFDRCDQQTAAYYEAIAGHLLKGHEHQRYTLLSVVCLPSFEPEWALLLLKSRFSDHFLALNAATDKLWSNPTSTIAVERLQAPIPSDLAATVCGAWESMLRRTRHHEKTRLGLDGVNYHFATYAPELTSMAGKVWSPNDETSPGKLVELSHLLYKLVKHGEDERSAMLEEVHQAASFFRRFK